jgi:hypothetical protein
MTIYVVEAHDSQMKSLVFWMRTPEIIDLRFCSLLVQKESTKLLLVDTMKSTTILREIQDGGTVTNELGLSVNILKAVNVQR